MKTLNRDKVERFSVHFCDSSYHDDVTCVFRPAIEFEFIDYEIRVIVRKIFRAVSFFVTHVL